MTLDDLIDLKNDYEQTLGNYRGIPTDEESTAQLNHALRIFGTKLSMLDPKVTVTLASGVMFYDLHDTTVFSRRVLKPESLIINGRILPSADGRSTSLWSLQELEQRYPAWRTTGAGTPILGAWYGNRRLIVWPAPSQAVIDAGNNYLSGQYIPGSVTASGTYDPQGFNANHLDSTPDLDTTLHEPLAFLAAVLSSVPVASEQVAWSRMSQYNALWTDAVDKIARDNTNAISPFGTTRGHYWSGGYWGR